MNHCVLEVDVLQAPTLRYTQDNQTPIAEMEVGFDAVSYTHLTLPTKA